MKIKGWQIGLGIAAVILLTAIITGANLWSHRMEIISLEQRIDAQYVTNQSNYDNMWKRFKEMTQVTELQAEQFKDVYTGLITGRYEDSELLFKMVSENNPQMGTEVYTNLQNAIESGRTSFANDQKTITDIIREYNTQIQRYVILNMFMNRQQKDAKDFIITSERTQNAFDSGKDDEIKIGGE